jgi:hypothetical protein
MVPHVIGGCVQYMANKAFEKSFKNSLATLESPKFTDRLASFAVI